MRKVALIMAIALLLCIAQSVVWVQGKPGLKYEEIKNRFHVLARASGFYSGMNRSKPSELKVIPKDLSDKVSYLVMPIGGKRIVFALDTGPEKPKLYIDIDADGDISDEKPIIGTTNNDEVKFDNVSIPVSSNGRKAKVRIGIDCMLWDDDRPYLAVYPAAVCSGKVKVSGKSYRLAVADNNLDGRYDSFLNASSSGFDLNCDYITIDLNRNGQFEADDSNREVFPLSRMIRIKDSYYSLNPAVDGSVIDIKAITPKFGTLDVGNPDMELSLISDTGSCILSGSEGKWQLPAGKYITQVVRLKKKDKAENHWALQCYGWEAGKLSRFEIREGEILKIEAGPPLTIKTKTGAEQGAISVGFSVLGRAGEQYRADVKKDDKRQPAPKLRIVDRSGKELVKDSFQYG